MAEFLKDIQTIILRSIRRFTLFLHQLFNYIIYGHSAHWTFKKYSILFFANGAFD